jgi:hypothetical protein
LFFLDFLDFLIFLTWRFELNLNLLCLDSYLLLFVLLFFICFERIRLLFIIYKRDKYKDIVIKLREKIYILLQ